MNFLQCFVPDTPRGFRGQRWFDIALRTLHLIGVAGLGGAWLYTVPEEQWLPWLWLTTLSGLAMVGLSLWSSGVWLLQLRGQLILLKVGLLALIFYADGPALPMMLAVLVISGIIAHAPAAVRYYRPWRRRSRSAY